MNTEHHELSLHDKLVITKDLILKPDIEFCLVLAWYGLLTGFCSYQAFSTGHTIQGILMLTGPVFSLCDRFGLWLFLTWTAICYF